MHLVTLVDKVLLINALPFVVFGLVVEVDRVDVYFWVLVTVKTFFESINLHGFA